MKEAEKLKEMMPDEETEDQNGKFTLKVVCFTRLLKCLKLHSSALDIFGVIMSLPWKGRETYCFSIASVRLCVTKSCRLYNLKTVRDISTKLHTFVKHIQTTCHAQEP